MAENTRNTSSSSPLSGSVGARDAILTILASQSSQQLSDITRRDSLKQEVRSALNGLLGDDGSVSRIYFTQFVLQ